MADTPTKWSAANITSPAMDFESIAVGASMTGGFKALFVGSAGDIVIHGFGSNAVLFVGVQAGTILPVMGRAVGTTASGTNAGSLVALK